MQLKKAATRTPSRHTCIWKGPRWRWNHTMNAMARAPFGIWSSSSSASVSSNGRNDGRLGWEPASCMLARALAVSLLCSDAIQPAMPGTKERFRAAAPGFWVRSFAR
eukprot:5530108-Prymnesium_polylepis.2